MGFIGKEKFQLGPYLVLPKHNKMIVDSNEYKIEPKIMEVLCYLITHKGEVVSREKIAETLWPNTFTGLEVVTRAIFELRKILKDDPKKPIYIETIARKGYCFIYDILDDKEEQIRGSVTTQVHPNYLPKIGGGNISFSYYISSPALVEKYAYSRIEISDTNKFLNGY